MFSRRQFLPSVQSPEFRPQRVFVARNSLTEPLVLGPRAEHCLQTESIRVFHVLVQRALNAPLRRKISLICFMRRKKWMWFSGATSISIVVVIGPSSVSGR
jgi:hypothetical protein